MGLGARRKEAETRACFGTKQMSNRKAWSSVFYSGTLGFSQFSPAPGSLLLKAHCPESALPLLGRILG